MKNVKNGHTQPYVMLDAGHYGKYNRSPVVKDYYESQAMWKLHLMLEEELEKRGMVVTITRAKQEKDMGLKARGQESKGADLFLSLHSNAASSESVDYPVVYHLYPDAGTQIDEQSKELAGMLAPVIAQVMGTKQAGKTATRKGSGDWNGDGVLNDNYYSVLNGARLVGTPALILEHSFHTNKATAQWLLKDENLRKLAQAEAEVIAKYFGMEEQKATSTTTQTFTLELPVLRKGCKGDAVRGLQAQLKGYGYDLGTSGPNKDGLDGSFGAKTENAVECYQEDNGLTVDGVAGPKTRKAMEGI